MSRFVRASKFRHVFGTPSKKENCWTDVKPCRNAWDTNLIKANPRFVAVTWAPGGGGAFCVLDASKPEKLLNPPLFTSHKADVLDIDFHPSNDYIIASASEDAKAMVWEIPENLDSVSTPKVVLSGHSRKVGHVLFHPTANNVLATSAGDLSVKIWDIETGQEKLDLIGCTDLIQCIAWSYDGSKLAVTAKDKKVRVFDPRAKNVIAEADSHQGAKGSRVLFLGDTDRIATTGFSKTSDRQLVIRDIGNLGDPLVDTNLDTSSGVLMPFYDPDTKMLYLAGKGDGNIRYYECVDEKPWQFLLSEYKSNEPQRGLAFAPKRACNVSEVEIGKAYKLHPTMIEPVSFKVPRKTDVFQADIYPDAFSGESSLSADEWFSGKNAAPKTISLEGGYTPGVKKEINFAAAPPVMDAKKDLDNPKNEKELREAWHKLKDENADLKNKLAQKDVQIRQLELKLGQA